MPTVQSRRKPRKPRSISKPPQADQPDFLPVAQLAALTSFRSKGIYNQHSSGLGPLVPILVKVGGRLGAWRADYEQWRDSQRRLKPETEQRPAA